MIIQTLELKEFRNYAGLHLEMSPKLNVLFGENGQGKTNLVEAIALLANGRSFRTPRDKELIRLGQETAYVKAQAQSRGRSFVLEIRLGGAVKKAVRVNGVSIEKLTDLLGIVNVVIFSPEDLKLVKEGPGHRRMFLDRELSQIRPKYYHLLSAYHQVLKRRSSLLKEESLDPDLLGVYNQQLAQSGYALMSMRSSFVHTLAASASETHGVISGGKEKLKVVYRPNMAAQSPEEYQHYLESAQKEDRLRGTTTRGIHRDELELKINGLDLRDFGSQGQKRSAAIALKLSEITLIHREVGEYPIVVLDDIFSELDQSRRRMLLEHMAPMQTFLTDTHCLELQARHFHIKTISDSGEEGAVAEKRQESPFSKESCGSGGF